MTPVLMKSKCPTTGMWHYRMLTSKDVQWFNTLDQKVRASGAGIGALPKILGKFYDMYIGIQDAIALQDQHREGEKMAVVYVPSLYGNCCVSHGTRRLQLYDDHGRNITHLYDRPPLKPSNRPNEKNDGTLHGKGEKVVETTKTVKVTCEPLQSSKQMNTVPTQQEVMQPKDEIKENQHQHDDDNGAIHVDENDTRDDRRHFPQHQPYTSRSIVQKKKIKVTKRP